MWNSGEDILNILFIGTTGIHHTLIAAYLYLGYSITNFCDLKFWGDKDKEKRGNPLYLDNDAMGNKVYVVGVGQDVLMGKRSIQQLVNLLHFSEQDLIVKPIFIKSEKMLFWLFKLSDSKIMEKITKQLIIYLLNKETDQIKRQVDEFRGEVRFV